MPSLLPFPLFTMLLLFTMLPLLGARTGQLAVSPLSSAVTDTVHAKRSEVRPRNQGCNQH